MSDHRQGPVRSEAARLAILHSTARLFESRGYDHLTMEGIAAEAGVGKQTIYRWWPSKAAIVADCLLGGLLLANRFTLPDTGDLRADLVTWLDRIFGVLAEPAGELLLRSLIAAATENAEVGLRLYESLVTGSSLAARLEADGAGNGVDVARQIGEALGGAILLRALSRLPATPTTSRNLVDAVLGSSFRSSGRSAV
ncbi:MAG: TetR/AcrR family transcriptional regulator [Burkholderiaceae bacterium]|nr:TetR/AcrR family transcriptional regulator [Microbacteriaceae bacterium]